MENKLPEGWKEYKIKDIGDVVTGNTPPKKDPENYGGILPWIKPPDLDRDKFVSTSEETISETGRKKVRLLPKGSVLVSCIGNIGKIAIADTELCTNQQINSIIPDENIVVPDFLYYTIKKMRPYLENIASSAVVPLLNKTDFSNIKIKLPPLEIQQKIVAILEKAEETKKLRAQADELTQKLLHSVFLEMFGDPATNPMGWNVFKIEEICTLIRDGEHKTPKYLKEGIPFVTATNLVGDSIDLINTKKISQQEHLDFCKRAKPEKGDLLISKDGTIGVSKVINTEEEFSIFVSVILLKLKREIIEPNFLQYLISTNSVQNEIRKRIKGIAIKHIHLIDLRSMSIPIPPLSEQTKFTHVVNFVELVKNSQQRSSLEINILFDALMQKAFTGELVS